MAQASIANMVNSNTAPPSTSASIQGSSKLTPIDVDANELASMADTVASIAGTVDSNAAPPAASTAIQGFSKLAPVNVDANDLASMADTAYAAPEPSPDSSSDSSISGDPPNDYQEDLLEHCTFRDPGATPAAPPDDMEMDLPEEDPDPVMEDANMLNSSTTPLLSVGDQQTLGTGPPTAPYGTLHPRFCLGRPRWAGINHSSWYHKTCHSWYWCSHQPQQMTRTLPQMRHLTPAP